ncbi:hypothetical protein [Massilia glaciei]|nr:hypothetical protein [Massilia glaciei]
MPEATALEAKTKRSHRIRTFIAVVAVLVIGLFAATSQFQAADNDAGGNAVGYWFGEWLVYGLFAYAVFRLPSRMPPGFAAVLAALFVVGGVNYKTYASISEERQALVSLARAAPLMSKLQSGGKVSDQEVKDAQVGMLEPLMLAQAAYSRELITITAAFTKVVSGLQVETMLTPTSLASPSIRAQTRAMLSVWQQSTGEYKSQLDAATARGKLGIQAAQSQMPAAMAGSALKGFEESSAQLSAYVDALVSSGKDTSGTITAILDLMDSIPGRYVVDKGPPVNLLFHDEANLTQYRQLMNEMVAASQRETEAQASFVKTQSDRTDKLTDLLKR